MRAAFIKNTIHHSNIVLCDWHESFWDDWRDPPLDLVFIDGDHRYAAVKRDIQQASQHLRKGGVLCGHDFCTQFPGVIEAVVGNGLDGLIGFVWWREKR